MRTEARHTIRASPVSRTGNAKHDRNSFYPVSLTAIADAKENYELENKISQLQESLGREMTEKKPVGPKADKSEIADRIDILINIAKREVPIDIIKLEEYGDIAFGTGRLKESLDAYETAAIW
ncbi:MAG: hypothetical protein QW112_03955, partial [Candidatus Micrarchaeia archaeon]